MTHYDIFNYKGVSESRKVARGPKDPPPGSYRVKVLENVLVGVINYTKLGNGPTNIGHAKYVGEAFYRTLKPRGCYTPSRFKKKQLFKN